MELEETPEDVARAVAIVESGNLHEKMQAIDGLYGLCSYGRLGKIGLSESQAKILLTAAFQKFPSVDSIFDVSGTYQTKLLLILCQCPYPSLTEDILRLYPQIDESDDRTQWQALELLSHMPAREAAEAWLCWYRKRLSLGKGVPPPFSNWGRDGLHADLLLPALIEFARTDDAWLADQWNAYIGHYLRNTAASETVIKDIVDDLTHLLDKTEMCADREPGNWMWDNDYFDLRWQAASKAEILGYVRGNAPPVLFRALASKDPRVRMAAGISLLKVGADFASEELLPVAQWSETRYGLYRQLKQMSKLKLFPRRFAKQHLLAESDMVDWMIHDGDPPPQNIAHSGTVESDGNIFHVFLFDWANEAHLGISGPWKLRGLEKTASCGRGNEFTERNSLSPQRQALDILSNK